MAIPLSSSSSSSSPADEDLTRWIKYTNDRPFNDHRYAVDATKLRSLGWEQRTGFAEGLRQTVAWYRQFGERWWGDITKVLTPFPTVAEGGEVVSDHEPISDYPVVGGKGAAKGAGEVNMAVNGGVKGNVHGHVKGLVRGEVKGEMN